jgi:hypothetical protein
LNRFEVVAFGAVVFVKRHREDLPTIMKSSSQC